MSASEIPFVLPPPSAVPQVGLTLLRPVSLDLERTGGHKMGYHTGLIVGGCCPPGGGGAAGAHLSRQDVMTYSQYVHGSIFSVPKSWQVDHGENLVLSVYTFLKTFLGWVWKSISCFSIDPLLKIFKVSGFVFGQPCISKIWTPILASFMTLNLEM